MMGEAVSLQPQDNALPAPSGAGYSSRARSIAMILIAILLVTFAAISWFAWLNKSPTYDETMHLTGALVQTFDGDFRCNPEDPPLWKYYAILGVSPELYKLDQTNKNWSAMLTNIPNPGYQFSKHVFQRLTLQVLNHLLHLARARMLSLGVLLGIGIAWWAWRIRGPMAAVVATAFFAFCPSFLAHAPLVKNDLSMALGFFLLSAAIWLLGERATLPRILAVSVFTGAALITKFSGVLAFPILGLALLGRAMIPKPWVILKWTARARSRKILGAGGIFIVSTLVGYLCIWAAYDFRFGPSRHSGETFDFGDVTAYYAEHQVWASQPAPVPWSVDVSKRREWVDHWRPDALVQKIGWANEHHFLPQAWLIGFMYTYGSSILRRSFLCGHFSIVGWWYYFPLAFLFKTPMATLLSLLFVSLFCVISNKHIRKIDAWKIFSLALTPALYLAVAMHGHLDIGIRHILPVYPFLFIFLGVVCAEIHKCRPRLVYIALPLILISLMAETLHAFPDYLPFFNCAVGGARGGIGLLSDSNIDWGQELPALADWQRQHPDRQLYLCYFGFEDPRRYGLHYIELPGNSEVSVDERAPNGFPAVYAISAVALQGTYLNPRAYAFYTPFRNRKPDAIIGGSIYLFDSLHNPLPPNDDSPEVVSP